VDIPDFNLDQAMTKAVRKLADRQKTKDAKDCTARLVAATNR